MLLWLYSVDYSDSDGTTPDNNTSTASEEADFGPRWPIVVGSATKDPETIEKAKIEKAKMLTNIQVYALAEKYDIHGLKTLARTKYLTLSAPYIFVCNAGELIESVFTTTPDQDAGIRAPLIADCALAVRQVLEDADMVDMVKEHGNFAVGMLRQVIKMWDEDLHKAKEEKREA
jgi:hypothetical protein